MEEHLPKLARKEYADAIEEAIKALQVLIRTATHVEAVYHDKDCRHTTLMSLGEMLNDLCDCRDELDEND